MQDKEKTKVQSEDKPKRVIYRDSITGQIVTEEYALQNPDTTEREEVDG